MKNFYATDSCGLVFPFVFVLAEVNVDMIFCSIYLSICLLGYVFELESLKELPQLATC